MGHFSQKLSVKCRQELFAREAHISGCERSNFQGKLSSGFWEPSNRRWLMARAQAPKHENSLATFLKNCLLNADRSCLLPKPISVAANVQTFRGNYRPDFGNHRVKVCSWRAPKRRSMKTDGPLFSKTVC